MKKFKDILLSRYTEITFNIIIITFLINLIISLILFINGFRSNLISNFIYITIGPIFLDIFYSLFEILVIKNNLNKINLLFIIRKIFLYVPAFFLVFLNISNAQNLKVYKINNNSVEIILKETYEDYQVIKVNKPLFLKLKENQQVMVYLNDYQNKVIYLDSPVFSLGIASFGLSTLFFFLGLLVPRKTIDKKDNI